MAVVAHSGARCDADHGVGSGAELVPNVVPIVVPAARPTVGLDIGPAIGSNPAAGPTVGPTWGIEKGRRKQEHDPTKKQYHELFQCSIASP